MDALAAVQVGARDIELQRLLVPDELGDDEALLAIEATGMCGTDWDQYRGLLAGVVPFPAIPGHETIGRIVSCGDTASKRWGLAPGARVAVESTVPCGACPPSAAGQWLFCGQRLIYGLTSVANEPGLSGGFAEYMVLRANSRVYPLPDHLTTEDAVFFNPLGAGFSDWGVRTAGTEPGDTIVIFGPGQRGLSCVVAARHAGAACIVVVGRHRSHWKLELARSLGATHTIDSETDSVTRAVRAATDGRMADRVMTRHPARYSQYSTHARWPSPRPRWCWRPRRRRRWRPLTSLTFSWPRRSRSGGPTASVHGRRRRRFGICPRARTTCRRCIPTPCTSTSWTVLFGPWVVRSPGTRHAHHHHTSVEVRGHLLWRPMVVDSLAHGALRQVAGRV